MGVSRDIQGCRRVLKGFNWGCFGVRERLYRCHTSTQDPGGGKPL